VPGADMLAELAEELRDRNVRFMLTRVITPVRQLLDLAGAMRAIKPDDVYIRPIEAVVDYLSSQYDDASLQELMRSNANSMRSLLQASLASAPAERQAALTAIMDRFDVLLQESETDRR
jgi:hypothetical protein